MTLSNMSDKRTKAAAESRRVIYDGRAFHCISSHLAGAAERRHQHQPFIHTSYKSARPDLQHKVCQASWGGVGWGVGGVGGARGANVRLRREAPRGAPRRY